MTHTVNSKLWRSGKAHLEGRKRNVRKKEIKMNFTSGPVIPGPVIPGPVITPIEYHKAFYMKISTQ